MSDMVDMFRALNDDRKAARADAWANREGDLQAIRDAGFTPKVISEAARHVRIYIAGQGWFDFWPSTGRWSQSTQPKGKRGKRGHGVERLIAALLEVAA